MVSLIQNYIDKGWGIIPIRPKGHINEKTGEVDEKIPYVKWADYRSSDGRKPDEDQILHWLSQFDHADWAVLTGYDNLVLVDIDDPNLYDLYLSNFTKCLMRTPSGGISFLIYSTVVPKAQTRINGVAVDIKAINGYAILPSRDLSDEEIALEEKEEKAGTRRDFIRHWIDDSEPEEIDDIYRHLESVLPLIKPDVKPGKGIPTAIQWAREHNIQIAFDGGRYLQVICPNPGHNDTKPSMSIYADGFWCHSCHFSGGLFALIKAYTSKSDDEIYNDFPGIKKQKKTITDNVIEIVGDNVTLVRDHNNNGYFKLADYSAVGINLLPINSKITRYWMATAAEKVIDKLPSSSVLNYVIEYFNGKCMSQGDKAKIYRRVGGDQKVIWYDLGNNNFVKITEDGISVYPYADVTFIRETNQGVQNVPSKKDIKSIFKLFRIINVKDEAQKILLLTWIVNSLIPWAQSPILLLCGARGSGKSFMGRIIKRTLDPVEGNASELLVNKPKDLNYLIGLLSHNAVAVLDNISRIDRETGDVLCNVVTGGVIPTRELYTTNDQVLIDIRSKLIITAINSQIFDTGAGDLAERTVSIEISRPDANYLSEEWLNEEFETYRSEIFGAILALIQGYLKEGIPTKGAVSEFRLTTFASVGRYISNVLKMNPSFDVAYRLSQTGMCQTSLEAEPVTDFFVWFVRKYGDTDFNNSAGWGISADILFGTYFTNWMTENNKVGMTDKKFPTTSSSLLNRLKRIEPDLKKIYAITVEPKGVHKGKKWFKLSCSNKEILNDGAEEELLDEQTSIEKDAGW
jgi:hypothetical protein